MVRPSTAWLAASSLSLLLCLVIAPPGHAQSGLLELSGDALDLGTAEVGAVAGPRSIELTNRADLPVTIAPLEVSLTSEAFAVDVSACRDTTLDAGESCSLAFTFVPSAAGPAEATGTISATVLGLPLADRDVQLAGVGELAGSAPGPSPTASTPGPSPTASTPDPSPTESTPGPSPTESTPGPSPTESAPGLPTTPRPGPSPESATTVRVDRPVLSAPSTSPTGGRAGTRDPLARAAEPLVPAGRRPAENVLLWAFVLTTLGYVVALVWTWYARHRRVPSGRNAPSAG